MKRILPLIALLLIAAFSPALAENLTVNGEMGSDIKFEIRKTVETSAGIRRLMLSFVVPPSFQSPTSNQVVRDLDLKFVPAPQEKKTEQDARGNSIVTAVWTDIPKSVDAVLSFRAGNTTSLKLIDTGVPFPIPNIPEEVRYYLKPTEQVPSDNPRVRKLAAELSSGVKTEFDAVQRVITYVVDHVKYVNPPVRYDAMYSLDSGKGNCQNFSHLSAALMRAMNIPVRIINGITLNRPFSINRKGGVYTFKMGQGRHSWIEVWFPDLGWVPIDPQQTAMFVPNRFIRIEVGADNNETKNDGMMRWSYVQGSEAEPRDVEVISSDFLTDKVKIAGKSEKFGPKSILLIPNVKAEFKRQEIEPPKPPVVIPDEDKSKLVYDAPFLFGNLEFPENIDFAFPPAPKGARKGEKRKSFLVETAEYVTTNITQYAQIFVLSKPVKLSKIGLALHKFGGDGQIWIDLYADKNGKPGDQISTSSLLDLEGLSAKPGYRWTDFVFKDEVILMPGSYWIGLGFTGNPIVNWFYTYGKPVGPGEGTRYKNVYEQDWSGALSYEFNYRVIGLTTRDMAQKKAAPQKKVGKKKKG